ncbi:hypothetical protein HMPREF1871_00737 [Gemelliphila asaccharolytica]|uniref:Uncharacterized protein n=1 Tax=Gemelliphila asaccharolytica TaxID=502393 RepID=A0ABR5TLM5_9BACL|nr:hypothetical protein HMPREF1871_00737 [Gemella asaccharolytica]
MKKLPKRIDTKKIILKYKKFLLKLNIKFLIILLIYIIFILLKCYINFSNKILLAITILFIFFLVYTLSLNIYINISIYLIKRNKK